MLRRTPRARRRGLNRNPRSSGSRKPGAAARGDFLNLPAVVSPMQQRLTLPLAAGDVAGLAVLLNLPHMTANRLPAPDLPGVLVRDAAAHVIAAIPLKPAARIVLVDPALLAPHRQRLAGIDAEIIQRAVALSAGKLGAGKPAFREFLAAVGHVFAAEHAEAEHLRRRQFGTEVGRKIPPGRRGKRVVIAALHAVVDGDGISYALR